jgi:hypothetical protein
MTRIPKLEFANVIIHFGDAEMIDLFEQVVLPAFVRTDLRRTSRGTDYFFLDVTVDRLIDSDANSLAVIGRLVKDTTLVVEQVWDEEQKKLIPTTKRVPSSPSALFALRIEDHKLLWLHEKIGAPSLKVFEATLRSFLKDAHEDFIKQELTKASTEAKQRSEVVPILKDITSKYPFPTLEVVTLASEASLEEFLKQFSVLTSVVIEFLIPNAELDNDRLFEGIRNRQTDIGSKSTKLTHNNGDGLNKGAALAQLKPAAEQANSRIKLVGKDKQGDRLSGNEEEFSVSVGMPVVDSNIVKAAKVMDQSLRSLVQSGTITFGQLSTRVRDEAKNVMRRLEDRDGRV